MSLSLTEIKDLLAYGQELGLQQLHTEGLTVFYGHNVAPQPFRSIIPESQDDTASLLAHYSAIGREKLQSHK